MEETEVVEVMCPRCEQTILVEMDVNSVRWAVVCEHCQVAFTLYVNREKQTKGTSIP